MATTSGFPLEIIETILLKLPVKPLLRFESVSKPWKALISDPVFVQNHHQKSISSNPQNLFLSISLLLPHKLSLVKLEEGKLQTVEEKPKGLPRGLNCVVCVGEGVLLLTNTSFSRYALFHPSTRTHTELVNQFDIHRFTCGFCRDPTTGDFKVVVLVSRSCYAVYSCKNKSWAFGEPLTFTLRVDWKSGVSVDGAIYWVRVLDNSTTTVIIYFDPRDDTLKILPKPKDLDDDNMICLADLRSSLCLYFYGEDKTTVQIWTKEKGIDNNSWKWKQLMTIRNVRVPIGSFEPQCFQGNKLLIENIYRSELMVYSPSGKILERFKIKFGGFRLVPYVDTLFSRITNTRPKRKRNVLY